MRWRLIFRVLATIFSAAIVDYSDLYLSFLQLLEIFKKGITLINPLIPLLKSAHEATFPVTSKQLFIASEISDRVKARFQMLSRVKLPRNDSEAENLEPGASCSWPSRRTPLPKTKTKNVFHPTVHLSLNKKNTTFNSHQ
jgi:hypothetical protein